MSLIVHEGTMLTKLKYPVHGDFNLRKNQNKVSRL